MVVVHGHSLRARKAGPGAMMFRTTPKFMALRNGVGGGTTGCQSLILPADIPNAHGQLQDILVCETTEPPEKAHPVEEVWVRSA